VTDTDPPSTLRELRRHLTAPFALTAQAGVALVAGLSGPFGTLDALGTPARLGYWAVVVFGTYALGAALTMTVLDRWNRDGAGAPRRVLRGGLMIGAAVSLWLAAVGLPLCGWRGVTEQVGAVSLVAAFAVSWLVLALREMWPAPPAPPTVAGAAPLPPRILTRLPLDRRGALIALSVQDHYVEVITTRGRDLILMRLADAMAEAEGVPGLQVHRSHWVALDQVRAARRQGDGAVLTLSDGREVPVSRARLPEIRATRLLP
jgi:hypothetical protein